MKKCLLKAFALTFYLITVNSTLLATSNQDTTLSTSITTNQTKYSNKAILVVSTGTTYNDIRKMTIDAIENTVANTFTDYHVYSAFSSQSIVHKIEERDHVNILDVNEAMQKLIDEKIETVIIQPTYVMNGLEFENMKAITEQYKYAFKNIEYGTPLLTNIEDYTTIADVLSQEATSLEKEEALVYMGHGTTHYANATYAALNYVLQDLGHHHIIIGTLESYPSIDQVIKTLKAENIKKVKLMPFMIIAGNHANTDMAGDDSDSWKSQLEHAGFEVECVIKGLGEYEAIQQLYVEHTQDAISKLN